MKKKTTAKKVSKQKKKPSVKKAAKKVAKPKAKPAVKSKAKPKAVAKKVKTVKPNNLKMMNFKANPSDRATIAARAKKFAQGNVSAWLRHAGLKYIPKKTEKIQDMPGTRRAALK